MNNRRPGIILVEVLVACGILGALLVPIIGFFITSLESNWFASREIKAQLLLQETEEALRSIRERNWEELTLGNYGLDSSGSFWSLVPSETGEQVDVFTRLITISPASRDEAGNLVTEGMGVRVDPSTRRIDLSVGWGGLRDREISTSFYLTRYLDSLSWQQTTKAEFDAGEMDLVKTIDPPQDNGEVILEGGCFSGSPESLIYDDQLRNGWRSDCSGLSFFRWLLCKLIQFFSHATIQIIATDYTWDDSAASFKVTFEPPSSGSTWSWARIYNYDGVCTKGFKNIHFYAFNPNPLETSFNFTAVHDDWDNTEVILPPQEWTEVNIDYDQAGGGYETNLTSIYFSKSLSAGQPATVVYLDQIELTGGVGGYFDQGSLTSVVFDAGRETAFNRIAFDAELPAQTVLGLQFASSDNSAGPWLFYGPQGTTSVDDLYETPAGEGLWLGNNYGRFCRYKAYLISLDGVSTPVLNEVLVNYSP